MRELQNTVHLLPPVGHLACTNSLLNLQRFKWHHHYIYDEMKLFYGHVLIVIFFIWSPGQPNDQPSCVLSFCSTGQNLSNHYCPLLLFLLCPLFFLEGVLQDSCEQKGELHCHLMPRAEYIEDQPMSC